MEFVDATSLEDALAFLAERGDQTTVLAGGTDVMVQYLRRELRTDSFLHIRNVPGLSGIVVNGRTAIGALTTHRQLAGDPHVVEHHQALVEAAVTVGGRQTQNVGTIAGNVVNASPAADLVPPLLVADATVALTCAEGSRELPLGEFLLGRRRTARKATELVTGLTLEPTGDSAGEVYLKVGRRHAMEVAVAGLAARIELAGDGTIAAARLAVCSVAPTPFRATAAEAALIGATPDDPDVLGRAGALLQDAASPIDDARATAAYRRRVLAPLLAEAIRRCRSRAGS